MIPVHPFPKHLIQVEDKVEGIVFMVSSMTREKNADISLASLGNRFGNFPASSRKLCILEIPIIKNKSEKTHLYFFFRMKCTNDNKWIQGTIVMNLCSSQEKMQVFGFSKIIEVFLFNVLTGFIGIPIVFE